MSKTMKNTMVLTIITLIAGLALGFVYEITKYPIAQAQDAAKKEAWQAVFPEADLDSFEQVEVDVKVADEVIKTLGIGATIDEVCKVGEDGYVITTTDKEGYGGDIEFMMGVRNDGSLNGISLLSIAETAGLGMRAEEVLKPQFGNKNAESFEYVKSGAMGDNQIEAISGATITTHAVTNGVNAGLYYFREMLMEGGNGNG